MLIFERLSSVLEENWQWKWNEERNTKKTQWAMNGIFWIGSCFSMCKLSLPLNREEEELYGVRTTQSLSHNVINVILTITWTFIIVISANSISFLPFDHFIAKTFFRPSTFKAFRLCERCSCGRYRFFSRLVPI